MTIHKAKIAVYTFLVGALLAVPGMGAVASAASTNTLSGGACQSVQLPMALASGQPANQTIAGTLCTPHLWSKSQHQIDILLHGATYNSSYWNFPYDNAAYSWVNDTLTAGRATFAYDNIGTGGSSRPSSTLATVDASAYILHQVIGWLHTKAYAKVDVVGHSYGSIITEKESATYNDANGIVLTGYLHALNPNAAAALTADLYPANQDPQFKNQSLDSGWITTRPGTRSTLFYNNTADPKVVAYDEAHKDIVSQIAFNEALPQILATPANTIAKNITIPVQLIDGQQDAVFCGGPADCSSNASLKAYEAQFYTHAASLTATVIPDTGHDLALHPTALVSFLAADQWIITH